GQSFAGVCGTLEERLSGPDLAPVLCHFGQRGGDQRCALARGSIGRVVSRRVIEGFGGMRQGVERGPDGRVSWQVERQLGLLNNAGGRRTPPPAPPAPGRGGPPEKR